jgi:hypothetical protein
LNLCSATYLRVLLNTHRIMGIDKKYVPFNVRDHDDTLTTAD